MKKRLIQVLGFVISTLGWVFVFCTMGMDHWRTYQIGGQGGSFIIKVGWYTSNLWKDCYTDSTSVTNCRRFPEQWSVEAYVQGVRGLLICGVTLGFFGIIFCFPQVFRASLATAYTSIESSGQHILPPYSLGHYGITLDLLYISEWGHVSSSLWGPYFMLPLSIKCTLLKVEW